MLVICILPNFACLCLVLLSFTDIRPLTSSVYEQLLSENPVH